MAPALANFRRMTATAPNVIVRLSWCGPTRAASTRCLTRCPQPTPRRVKNRRCSGHSQRWAPCARLSAVVVLSCREPALCSPFPFEQRLNALLTAFVDTVVFQCGGTASDGSIATGIVAADDSAGVAAAAVGVQSSAVKFPCCCAAHNGPQRLGPTVALCRPWWTPPFAACKC